MKTLKPILWLALCGFLWGLVEMIGGDFFYHAEIPLSSVWLASWAFFMLSLARGIHSQSGSSTFVAMVAILFRSVNASPFFCHLLGIFFLGAAFDFVASFLLKKKWRNNLQKSLSGIFSAYGGYASFALVVTYIIRHEFWLGEGFPRIMNHIFIGGSIAALLASVVVPVGYNIGKKGKVFLSSRLKWAYSLGFLILFLIWPLKI